MAAMDASPRRVLVIADNVRLREQLLHGLHRRDFEVVAVTTGNELTPIMEGLSAGAANPGRDMDVILLDVPAGPDPLALLVLHRLNARGISVSTVCLTTPADHAQLAARETARPSSLVMKPVDLAELAAELRRAAS